MANLVPVDNLVKRLELGKRLLILTLSLLVISIWPPVQSDATGKASPDARPPIANLPQPGQSNNLNLKHNKFLLLTNGNQLKLYPFTDNLSQIDHNYIIEPRRFNLSGSSHLNHLGDNKLDRWYQEQAELEASRAKQKPILPHRSGDFSSDNFSFGNSSKSGWRRPWQTQVDYFFDPNYCEHHLVVRGPKSVVGPAEQPAGASPNSQRLAAQLDNQCLVIIWLDKENRFLRYGSLDLSKYPMIFNKTYEVGSPNGSSSLPMKQTKRLQLNEFPPIDVESLLASGIERLDSIDVNSIVMDRKSRRLNVVISLRNPSSNTTSDEILIGKLNPVRYILKRNENIIYSSEFILIDRLKFNECQQQLTAAPSLGSNSVINVNQASFDNLQLDRDDNDLMFYLDKNQGGKIFAIQLKTMQLENTESNQIRQMLVLDLKQATSRLAGPIHGLGIAVGHRGRLVSSELDRRGAPLGMALDYKRKLIYWLNAALEIFSCDYFGENVQFLARLTLKPDVRQPYDLQVHQDTLLISDSFKKSLIAYKLPVPLDDGTRKQALAISQQNQASPSSSSTHQVLLVEMPSLYGFKIIQTNSNDALAAGTGSSKPLINAKPTPSSSVHRIPKTISQNFDRDRFEELISHWDDFKSSAIQFKCKYDQANYDSLLKQEAHIAYVYFILNLLLLATGLPILVLIVLSLYRHRKVINYYSSRAKQANMINDKEPLKCQF